MHHNTNHIIPALFLAVLCPFFMVNSALADNKTAAWLIRWHYDSPAKIKKICAETGKPFDHLLVQARGRADAWYQSRLAPRAETLERQSPDFDPLGEILNSCADMPIQAWLNVYYLWTGDKPPKAPQHPAQAQYSWILKDHNGKAVSSYSELEQKMGWIEGIYADPSDEEYRKLFVSIVQEVITNYPVSGIHLDFLRYPGSSYGFSSKLGLKFEKQWGFDPRWLQTRIKPTNLDNWFSGAMEPVEQILTTGCLIWAEMRAAEVTKLVHQVRRVLDESGRQLILSAAVFPDPLTAYLDKGQDWQEWAAEELVDELYFMTYFGKFERVLGQLAGILSMESMTKINLWAGLGGYIKKEGDIRQEAFTARKLGYNIALFSLGHLMKKKAGLPAYIQAIVASEPEGHKVFRLPPAPASAIRIETGDLKFPALPTAGKEEKTAPHRAIVRQRLAEFENACRTIIPQTFQLLEKQKKITTPEWLELRGIFRYLDPHDSPEKNKEQLELCTEACRLIKEGQNFATISRKSSQAGSKKHDGLLPRRYLAQRDKTDLLLDDLAPMEVSPVIKEANGYWCYQVLKKGKAEKRALGDIPWSARRVLFRERLALQGN